MEEGNLSFDMGEEMCEEGERIGETGGSLLVTLSLGLTID